MWWRDRNIPAVQLDDDLAGTMVVNLLELANVACKRVVSMLRRFKSRQILKTEALRKHVRSPPVNLSDT